MFNASTNVHEGDWDSSITVAVNLTKREILALYYQHHTKWLTRLNTDPQVRIEDWLSDWDAYERKRMRTYTRPAFSFSLERTHPIGFVAKGAHGVYPTPGTTMYGISIPAHDDLPFIIDDRGIGMCLAPQNIKDNIGAWPDKLSIPDSTYAWDEPELVEDELSGQEGVSALWFRGHWGEVVKNKEGWSGPNGPLASSVWRHCISTENFVRYCLEEDYDMFRDRYSQGGIPLTKILQSKRSL
jgi:hypothetical protein